SATDTTQQRQFDKVDQKAKLIILVGVSNDVQPQIRDAKTAKEAWYKLSIVYEAKNKN
ncbi:hypothetical protein KI387_014043, partial [Taxus chinensis]